ncbi:hydrogenase maturation protease [Lutibacter holmesii]|uniref:Hydrogenase maturation protease n=1 Tax=Lutibacter holmesii TaxID=1137985 RepID=A0ABW3WM50_9FLAO
MKELDNTLIIGIGNNTRQDDGLGWYFLDKLQEANFNPKDLLYKYQLMVEDAEIISAYKTVVFVDASKEHTKEGFSLEQIEPAEHVLFSTHEVPPSQILNLSSAIYNKKPTAFVLKIDGYQWDFKIELSKQAQLNLQQAYHYFMSEFLSKIIDNTANTNKFKANTT